MYKDILYLLYLLYFQEKKTNTNYKDLDLTNLITTVKIIILLLSKINQR